MRMHADQHDIDLDTARRLIVGQFPQWARLPVRQVMGAGTVNAMFRVGEEFSARFPLQGADSSSTLAALQAEGAGLRELAAYIPFATPQQVALGAPGYGYPLPWSVQTWVPGEVATPTGLAASLELAEDVAELISALRAQPTGGRSFSGNGRGGHLSDHVAWVEHCLAQSEGLLDTAPLRALWAELVELPRPGVDVMSHSDLTPFNLLVRGGRLVGVLDPGLGPADPALDLVAAWHLFDAPVREVLRERLGSSDVEWARGAAWALQQALGLVWYYQDTNPPMAALGRSTLARLLEATELR
ncbi:MAG: aminoglycoside phosphotransferase family protein [Trueperaceae bacterium]|nr:aminoglycoside phosphotransferase family protein [Trueperaceae bacterium]